MIRERGKGFHLFKCYFSNIQISQNPTISNNPNLKAVDDSSFYTISQTPLSGYPSNLNLFHVLGIETSFDDTAIAIVRSDGKILSNIISNAPKLHSDYGGVVPSIAAKRHEEQLPIIYEMALRETGLEESEIDGIAVTTGPGLDMCLWRGVHFANKLINTKHQNTPYVGIHHIAAHALSPRLDYLGSTHIKEGRQIHPEFPYLSLVVSGGHTLILLVRGVGEVVILGSTMDNAIGDVFDKISRELGISDGVNGGKEVERVAMECEGDGWEELDISVPLIYSPTERNSGNFSFAGSTNNFIRKTARFNSSFFRSLRIIFSNEEDH